MTGAGASTLRRWAARAQIFLAYFLTMASSALVFQWGVDLFSLFQPMSKAEQFEVPGVARSEVYEMEPWLKVLGHLFLGGMLLAFALYAAWGTREFVRAWSGRRSLDDYLWSAGPALFGFWVLSLLAFIAAMSIGFGILGGISYGMD